MAIAMKKKRRVLFSGLLRGFHGTIKGISSRGSRAEANASTNSSSARRHCKQSQLKEGFRILQDTEQPVESSALYQSLLQSCIEKKALAEGKLVHAHIIQRGVMADIFLASTLINMYAKGGGTLAETRRVFDQLPERDAVSWTVMIAAYSRHGRREEAKEFFCQMKRLGFQPNEYTFVSILPVCSDSTAVEEIHGQIVTCGFEQNVILGNTLVDMYAKCGSIENARYAFDKMPQPDVVSWTTLIAGYLQNGCVREALDFFQTIPRRTVFSWTAMISGYVQNGHGGEALDLFRQMQLTGVKPNSNTFTSVLPACANLAALKQGMEIHAQATKNGLLQSDVFVENALVDMYGKCGSIENACNVFGKMHERNVISWTVMMAGFAQNGCLDDAFKLFQEMPVKNVISWTVLIAGCAQNGCLEEAVTLFQQMQAAGLKPNSNTFASVLSACANLTALDEGMMIHGKIIKNGFLYDVFVGSALVDMYAKCDSIENARSYFDRMPERNTVSWTTMIRAYVQIGHSDVALKLFQQMQVLGLKPDPNTFSSILPACANLAALDQGKEIHVEIIKCKFQSDIFIANALVDMYAKCGSIKKARSVFDNIHQRDVVSWTAMIAGYAKNGYIHEALDLFQKMPEQNTVSWNAMIAGYAQNTCVYEALYLFRKMPERNIVSWTTMVAGYAHNGLHVDALKLFGQMLQAGVKPDSKAFVAVLPACAYLADLKEGIQIHEEIIRSGFLSDVFVQNALVDMYAKCGSIERARTVFDEMSQQNTVSWTVMIAGYAMHGSGKEALQLFERMQSSCVRPDHVTLLCVLSACCHAGLVKEGRHHFDHMSQYYHIDPAMEHYSCMVDLLGRAGHLEEAQNFIDQMPIKPNSTVWGCLLGACRSHNNIGLGQCVAEFLFEFDPKNATPYVLLANMYGAAGKWDDIRKLRKKMKDRKIKKMPGCSWIEVNKETHAFIVGDI